MRSGTERRKEDRGESARPLTREQVLLLSALEFLGRMATDRPPSEWDRITKGASIGTYLLEVRPDLINNDYFGPLFAAARTSGNAGPQVARQLAKTRAGGA